MATLEKRDGSYNAQSLNLHVRGLNVKSMSSAYNRSLIGVLSGDLGAHAGEAERPGAEGSLQIHLSHHSHRRC